MLRQVIGWAIFVLGFGGIIALIIIVNAAQNRARKKLTADIKRRKKVYERVGGKEYFKLVKEDEEEAERR